MSAQSTHILATKYADGLRQIQLASGIDLDVIASQLNWPGRDGYGGKNDCAFRRELISLYHARRCEACRADVVLMQCIRDSHAGNIRKGHVYAVTNQGRHDDDGYLRVYWPTEKANYIEVDHARMEPWNENHRVSDMQFVGLWNLSGSDLDAFAAIMFMPERDVWVDRSDENYRVQLNGYREAAAKVRESAGSQLMVSITQTDITRQGGFYAMNSNGRIWDNVGHKWFYPGDYGCTFAAARWKAPAAVTAGEAAGLFDPARWETAIETVTGSTQAADAAIKPLTVTITDPDVIQKIQAVDQSHLSVGFIIPPETPVEESTLADLCGAWRAANFKVEETLRLNKEALKERDIAFKAVCDYLDEAGIVFDGMHIGEPKKESL